MIFNRMAARLALAPMAAVALWGCTLNDKFAVDAVQYNREAEQSQDQVILLNVLRASRRRPFEFSGVQTISGAASTSGQVGLSIPIAQNSSMTPLTLSPQISRSAGPTVTVGVVDTQDFYSGLLKPVNEQMIDLFVQRGLPRVMLFDLFFSRVGVRQGGKQVATFSNAVDDQSKYQKFQTLIVALAQDGGLSTHSSDDPKAYGPLMTAEEIARQPGYAARAATAGLDVKAVGWCDLPHADQVLLLKRPLPRLDRIKLKNECDALDKQTEAGENEAAKSTKTRIDDMLVAAGLPVALYRTQKANTDYGLCFDPSESKTSDSDATFCDPKQATALSVPAMSTSYFVPVGGICDAVKAGKMAEATIDCSKPLEFSFSPRSTYGVIYYLGEIVREKLYPDSWSKSKYVQTETSVGSESPADVPLFKLDQVAPGLDTTQFLAVDYDGHTYEVPDSGDNQTYEVLDIVTELIALNKSSKDLPASSVITAVGLP